jgi:hypothetical protein
MPFVYYGGAYYPIVASAFKAAEPALKVRAGLALRAKIDNVQLHCLTAGHGPTVILLHGYAETRPTRW